MLILGISFTQSPYDKHPFLVQSQDIPEIADPLWIDSAYWNFAFLLLCFAIHGPSHAEPLVVFLQ